MDAALLTGLPAEVREQLSFWRQHFEPLLELKKGITTELMRLSYDLSVPFPTVKRKFNAVRKLGWVALVDRRICGPAAWNTREKIGLSEQDKSLVKRFCEENQRKNAPAVDKLRADWRAGRVFTSTPLDPRTRYPRGWTSRNLLRYAPTAFELSSVRQGRSAAAAHRQLVYSTRAGLVVGQFYLFDDMWHDHMVNHLDQKKCGRPLEFHALDLKSACKFAYGMRVRTENDAGVMEGLKGADMRFLLASILGNIGYHPLGTTLIVEHGTAAIPDWLEKLLFDYSGGMVRVDRSGMEGAAAHAGQYAGRSKGNFRFKAALESLGNLIHNRMAHLPAQTGMDVDHRPEGLHGLLKHNDALLAAFAQLPRERAEMLQWPMLTLQQFRVIADDIYQSINSRTTHNLEGWDANYVPDNVYGGMRRLSPWEVWTPGRRDLKTFDPHVVSLMLFNDSARERRVSSHMIAFKDSEISGDELRFDAPAAGLIEGQKYATVLNPYRPDELYCYDAKGAFAGIAPRIFGANPGDVESVSRAMGHAAKREAEGLLPLRQRHLKAAREKKSMHEHNTRVISGAPITPEDKFRAAELKRNVRRDGAVALSELLADAAEPALSTYVPSSSALDDDDDVDLIL